MRPEIADWADTVQNVSSQFRLLRMRATVYRLQDKVACGIVVALR